MIGSCQRFLKGAARGLLSVVSPIRTCVVATIIYGFVQNPSLGFAENSSSQYTQATVECVGSWTSSWDVTGHALFGPAVAEEYEDPKQHALDLALDECRIVKEKTKQDVDSSIEKNRTICMKQPGCKLKVSYHDNVDCSDPKEGFAYCNIDGLDCQEVDGGLSSGRRLAREQCLFQYYLTLHYRYWRLFPDRPWDDGLRLLKGCQSGVDGGNFYVEMDCIPDLLPSKPVAR